MPNNYYETLTGLPSNLQSQLFGGQLRQGDIQVIKNGYNSVGGSVSTASGEKLFVKSTAITSPDQARELLAANRKNLGKTLPTLMGMVAVLEGGAEIIKDQEDLQRFEGVMSILTIAELVDPAFVPLVDLMKKHGIQTIQTDGDGVENSWFDFAATRDCYSEIIEQMVAVHSLEVTDLGPKAKEEAYREGLKHVVVSGERFDAIAGFVPNIPGAGEIIKPGVITKLRGSMLNLVENYSKSAQERIAMIHGDFWMANVLVAPPEDGQEKSETRVRPIDPAPISYADGAYDVVFALSDLIFTALHRNAGDNFGGEFSTLASEMLEKYKMESGDHEIQKFMALFFMYKAFVAAVFDAGDNQVIRKKLIDTALGVAELSSSSDFVFDFARLDEYAAVGGAQLQN